MRRSNSYVARAIRAYMARVSAPVIKIYGRGSGHACNSNAETSQALAVLGAEPCDDLVKVATEAADKLRRLAFCEIELAEIKKSLGYDSSTPFELVILAISHLRSSGKSDV